MKLIKVKLKDFKGEDIEATAVVNQAEAGALASKQNNEEAAKQNIKDSKIEEVADKLVKETKEQGPKETEIINLKPYTESVNVKTRKELASLITEAKKSNKKFKVSRSLEEGFRYLFEAYEDEFEEDEELQNAVECVFVRGNRDAYGPDQIEDNTITVGELIEILDQYDENLKVFLRNDNGYTFGSISNDSISLGEYNSNGESALKENYDRKEENKDKEILNESEVENDSEIYVYQFPELTQSDSNYLSNYNLEIIKEDGPNGDMMVKGTLKDLRDYCEDILAYEMHPDFLCKFDEFADAWILNDGAISFEDWEESANENLDESKILKEEDEEDFQFDDEEEIPEDNEKEVEVETETDPNEEEIDVETIDNYEPKAEESKNTFKSIKDAGEGAMFAFKTTLEDLYDLKVKVNQLEQLLTKDAQWLLDMLGIDKNQNTEEVTKETSEEEIETEKEPEIENNANLEVKDDLDVDPIEVTEDDTIDFVK